MSGVPLAPAYIKEHDRDPTGRPARACRCRSGVGWRARGSGSRCRSRRAASRYAASSRVDYAKLFRGRSFNRERVAKPADSLVRYRCNCSVKPWRASCLSDRLGLVT